MHVSGGVVGSTFAIPRFEGEDDVLQRCPGPGGMVDLVYEQQSLWWHCFLVPSGGRVDRLPRSAQLSHPGSLRRYSVL